MKIKIIIILVLLIALAFLVGACNLLDNILDFNNDETLAPTPTKTVSPITVTPTNIPTSTPTVEPTPTQIVIFEGSSVGEWIGDEFVSEWANLVITMPQGWHKLTGAQIKEINQLGENVLTNLSGETIDELNYPANIFPMHIMKYPLGTATSDINTNLSIFFEKTAMDEEDYFEILYEDLLSMSMGYTFGDITTIEVANKNFAAFDVYLNEYSMQQLMLCRRHEDYMIGIIITADKENNSEVDDLLNRITTHK